MVNDKAIGTDSFRQKMGKNRVQRILHTKPLLDDKWIRGVDRKDLKKYMVVDYPKALDAKINTDKEHFAKGAIKRFHTDDWNEAQNYYMSLCSKDDVVVEKIKPGKPDGDDPAVKKKELKEMIISVKALR